MEKHVQTLLSDKKLQKFIFEILSGESIDSFLMLWNSTLKAPKQAKVREEVKALLDRAVHVVHMTGNLACCGFKIGQYDIYYDSLSELFDQDGPYSIVVLALLREGEVSSFFFF